MTPFRNDAANPFDRQGAWPRLPQAPLALDAADSAPGRPAIRFETLADEEGRSLLWFDSHRLAFSPANLAAPREAPEHPPASQVIPLRPYLAPARRRELRLTPLVAAASVGAGGLLALFLLIGLAPERQARAAPAPASRLVVGELVAVSHAAVGPAAARASGGR